MDVDLPIQLTIPTSIFRHSRPFRHRPSNTVDHSGIDLPTRSTILTSTFRHRCRRQPTTSRCSTTFGRQCTAVDLPLFDPNGIDPSNPESLFLTLFHSFFQGVSDQEGMDLQGHFFCPVPQMPPPALFLHQCAWTSLGG